MVGLNGVFSNMVPRMGEESDTFSATQEAIQTEARQHCPTDSNTVQKVPTILVERAAQTTLLHSLERFPLKQLVCAIPFAEF